MVGKQSHILVVPFAGWGHLRPLIHLSLNLLHTHPNLHVSLLLAPSVSPRVEKELKTVSLMDANIPRDRLQSINVTSSMMPSVIGFDPAAMAAEAQDYAACLPKYINYLFGKGAKPENVMGNQFEGVKPGCVVFDTFQTFVPDVMDSMYGKGAIPLLGFCPCNATAAINHYAPLDEGGLIASMGAEVMKAIEAGKDPLQAHAEFAFAGSGKVIQLPGLPKLFDYEIYPMSGACPIPPQVFMQVLAMQKAIHHPSTKGLIFPAFSEVEPEATSVAQDTLQKPIHMVGMQFPELVWRGEQLDIRSANEDDNRVIQFLDDMEKKYGTHSVIYVSLGSLFWPLARPELIDYIIESLLESPLPLLFAHASDMSAPSPAILQKIEDSEKACAVKFAPQWAVLNHPATGFFLSHCGSNSTAEAVVAKDPQPIIAMPFMADQGEFAALLKKYGCAIDIKQVKSFKPAHFDELYDGTKLVGTEVAIKEELREIWKRIRGEEGTKMREEMKRLKEVCVQSHQNGSARKEMEGLSRYF